MKNLVSIFSLLVLVTPIFAQQGSGSQQILDVQHYEISAEVVPEEGFLKGEVKIRFVLLEDSVSLPFELNPRLSLLEVTDEEDARYSMSFDNFESSRMRIRGPGPFQKDTETTLIFRFEGTLETEVHRGCRRPDVQRPHCRRLRHRLERTASQEPGRDVRRDGSPSQELNFSSQTQNSDSYWLLPAKPPGLIRRKPSLGILRSEHLHTCDNFDDRR